jgi:Glycosyltransferase family 10 (fucosyltransferase) C-term
VYLGDSEHLRRLLPHPNAAIFVSDYNGNYTRLAEHLTYLSNNETAYEMHRQWRSNYSYENHVRDKPLLATSWTCRVCQWVADNAGKLPRIRADEHCLDIAKSSDFHENISHFEGRLILWKAHKPSTYFLVVNATLRPIPIEKTFEWLNIEAEDAIPVTYEEINKCNLGLKYHPI